MNYDIPSSTDSVSPIALDEATLEGPDWASTRGIRMPAWMTAKSPPLRFSAATRGKLQRCGGTHCAPAKCPPNGEALVRRSPGKALEQPVQALMGARFGHDFSKVRIHTDATAAERTNSMSAVAFTTGEDISFASGRYAPRSSDGMRLLAHELAHVVQQSSSAKTTARGQAGDAVLEGEAEKAEHLVDRSDASALPKSKGPKAIQLKVIPEHVSCHTTGLTHPDLTGDEAVSIIRDADAAAITMAKRAEETLDANRLHVEDGDPVDAEFDTILQEELGLSLSNRAQFPLIQQQANRFRRVWETLDSGYYRYICRGEGVTLAGCTTVTCGENFAWSCPGNRLTYLCQAFWDQPLEQPGTILHEPFHIWFTMQHHRQNALRRADADCFESFARRLAGEAAPPPSCVGHTAG